ncbi:MAG: M48 family metallopeptidase [Catonella sp.]
MSIETRKIKLGGEVCNYTLERKSVKNINLRIKPGQVIYVSADKRVSVGVIEAFIRSKEVFILEAFERIEKNRKNKEAGRETGYNTGDEITYFNRKLGLKIVKASKESVKASGESIYIFVKDIDDRVKKENLLKKWELTLAKEVFTKVIDCYYPAFKALGVAYPKLSIRTMTSRWGSCKPNGEKITLNLELLHKPKECLEYVVVHELAHFIHPNHSKDFWNLVENMMPDYKKRKDILNDRQN